VNIDLVERVEDVRDRINDWINQPITHAQATAVVRSDGDPAVTEELLRQGQINSLWRRVGVSGVAVVLGLAVLIGIWALLSLAWNTVTGIAAGAHPASPDATHSISIADPTPVVSVPLTNFVTAHGAGLPISAGQLLVTWLAFAALLWVAAVGGTRGGQLGWVLIGVATVGAVWFGDTDPHRPLSAALTALAWAVLSIPALRRVRR
jgi:hypothetical protein